MNDLNPQSADFSSVWLRLWTESTHDYSIFALSPQGIVLTWNPGGERIQGYQSEEIVGQPFSIFYPETERASGAPKAALRAAADSGRYVVEGWRVRKDGTTFWANVVMTALRDRQGQLIGFGKVIQDVSDKKAAHDAVLQSERSFRLLVQGVTDYAIFMLSPDGQITSWNSGARRIKGYTEKFASTRKGADVRVVRLSLACIRDSSKGSLRETGNATVQRPYPGSGMNRRCDVSEG